MGVEAKNRKVLAMADSIIMERVADAAAECFYAELVKTEDPGVGPSRPWSPPRKAPEGPAGR